MTLATFGTVLSQHDRAERVTTPEDETFVTLRLGGKGAVARNIGAGKTPQPFSGYRVSSGQFIYSRIDARNGAFAILPKALHGAVVSKDFPVFDIDQALVDPGYLLAYVNAPGFSDGIKRLSFGATNRQRVKEDVFLALRIPLPPLPEQRRIAAILDKADHLRTQRREALAHLDALTQSIFSDMFGDLNPTTTKWPVLPVGNVCTVIVDCVNKTAPLADSQTPYKMIRTSNVRGRSIDLTSVRFVDENTFVKWNSRAIPSQGDVVLTREAPMGEAGIIPPGEKVFLGQRTMLYRSNPALLTAEYLLYFLTSEYMQREYTKNGSGSTVKHLSVPYCRTLEVATPPVELQQIFARRVAGVELLKEQHRAQLAELDTLFASLQHRAFSGQL